MACAVCVNRCKQCPGGAVSVVKVPTNLTTNVTHQYGPNSFKLHGLPSPRPGRVLGLLGTNGSGKSTALKILSGRIKPNLGHTEEMAAPEWSEVVSYYRGSDLQNYFKALVEDRLKFACKPQLEAGFVRRLRGQTVRSAMEARNERGRMDYYCRKLELDHLLDRNLEDLSGGELQRFAAACTFCRDANVYLFDEVTSFLDIHQRLKVSALVREIVEEDPGKHVVVVEHDLAILDAMSDYVQCLYGSPGAYGVVTGPSRVRNGINQFLAGYFRAENMRFRDHELTFKTATPDFLVEDEAGKSGAEDGATTGLKVGTLHYPASSFTRESRNVEGGVTSKFTLSVEAGSLRDGECVVLMGENGTGKTTFMEMLAGRLEEEEGSNKSESSTSLASQGVSYKEQGLNPKLRRFSGTVQDILEKRINAALGDRLFRLLVMKALKVDEMLDLPVASLSGGEMQRLSIALCLGKPARFYLIDEPSAALDCEQRIVAAKVMKRWVASHLGRTLLLVEHDFVMASAMADRVVVYEGTPGVECTASSPMCVADGFNRFLSRLNVTIRLDPINFRPRINKRGGRIDKEQRTKGEYYAVKGSWEEEN
uniref:ABC transporter domain-containing protein n=1 Tax=Pseudictyota dubia TaxID=2749911 RepID=A0A7R9ZHT3_9STRA|mmetsp:Transcript_6221/g.10674  ORF Transcript_6221/g.10674 Transcript_6221/m.10674 type:complete len:594 (+) Transcript_6221:409-2190(+)